MIIDIIIVVLIAISVFLGYKKGLIKLGISLIALVISVIVTVVLYNPIANLVINTTNIDETVENHIYEKVIKMMENNNDKEQSYLGISVAQAENGMLPTAAEALSINIVRLGVFLVLLIALRIGIRFINALATFIEKLPIIKQFNKVGGLIYGLIRGLIVLLIVLAVIRFITQINPQNKIYSQIDKSYITKPIYENNIINIFFE